MGKLLMPRAGVQTTKMCVSFQRNATHPGSYPWIRLKHVSSSAPLSPLSAISTGDARSPGGSCLPSSIDRICHHALVWHQHIAPVVAAVMVRATKWREDTARQARVCTCARIAWVTRPTAVQRVLARAEHAIRALRRDALTLASCRAVARVAHADVKGGLEPRGSPLHRTPLVLRNARHRRACKALPLRASCRAWTTVRPAAVGLLLAAVHHTVKACRANLARAAAVNACFSGALVTVVARHHPASLWVAKAPTCARVTATCFHRWAVCRIDHVANRIRRVLPGAASCIAYVDAGRSSCRRALARAASVGTRASTIHTQLTLVLDPIVASRTVATHSSTVNALFSAVLHTIRAQR